MGEDASGWVGTTPGAAMAAGETSAVLVMWLVLLVSGGWGGV